VLVRPGSILRQEHSADGGAQDPQHCRRAPGIVKVVKIWHPPPPAHQRRQQNGECYSDARLKFRIHASIAGIHKSAGVSK
jgi:hypothetical protein